MDEDLLRQLPEEYARLGDRRAVMAEALGRTADLHPATTRLGDAIAQSGLPGRAWRSRDADLRLLAATLPNIPLDDLLARLAEFTADTGPAWLHGDRRDLEAFRAEVDVLYGVIRPLHVVAQRLQLLPPQERSDLPIEQAFGHVRVMAPLREVATILGDLEALGPFMAPLATEEWEPALAVEPPAALEPAVALPLDLGAPSAPPPAATPTQTRLRDFALDGTAALRPRRHTLRNLPGALLHYTRPLGTRLQTPKLLAVVGLILVVGAGIVLLGRALSPRTSALGASPAKLQLICSSRAASGTLTLTNRGSGALTWQIAPPSGLSVTPGRGTLAPGAKATVRVTVAVPRRASGTLAITAGDGSVAVPYTVSCP